MHSDALRSVVLAAVALACACRPATAATASPVRAELLADVATVTPGRPFRLGVRLHMEPGWHTYWRHAGDAGMPTEVVWDSLPGVRVSPLRWPVPAKYTETGGLTAYGYRDQVLLLATADYRPGPGAAVDSLRLSARVSWLACRELCVPGNALLGLVLPVGSTARPSAHDALFAEYERLVPGPLPAAAGVQVRSVHAQAAGRGVRVVLALAGAAAPTPGLPDFLPADPSTAVQVAVSGAQPPELALEVTAAGRSLPDSLRGVVIYGAAGTRTVVSGTLAIPLGQGAPAPDQPDSALVLGLRDQARPARSVWGYVPLALLGGLLLNLMPCVLPVISLKVLGFVSQAGQLPTRARRLGLAFAAGIVATFAVLALVVVGLRLAGQQVGWGFQFQHPGFVMAMSAVVFALALSLFGLFTIRVGTGSLGAGTAGESLTGSFLNGVLATVLATPCTAPFLGTALGFAFAQPAPLVVGLFVTIGAGMAAPYAVLAARPGWLRLLPRPGPWMGRFEQGMGFVMLGTVLWLLWVLGKQLGAEGVVWTGVFLLVVAVALWVPGQWTDLRSSRRRRRLAWAVAVLLVVAGARGLLVPLLRADRALAAAAAAGGAAEQAWEPFTRQRAEQLLRVGRQPLLLVFTAEWCWTCKVNERTVLADAAVRERMRELDLAVLRADWTARDPEITSLLADFGRSGVPLYVLYGAGAPGDPLVLPELLTTGTMLRYLDQVAGGSGGPHTAARTEETAR